MLAQEQDQEARTRHESRSSVSSTSSTSSGGSSSSSDSSISMPPAPDGGYGWVIVLSAFLVSFISDGLTLSFGVLFTELLEVFKESKGVTSIIASLFYGIPLLCGPIASATVTKLGCRKAQIMGGLITSVGVFASAFVDSIGLICFTFGFVAGFGLSIGYVNSLVVVAYYFEKKRSMATGLAVCGSGIGTFVFAPFLEFLIEEYGWRGSFIILSAVTLNLVVCGALMRPLEFTPMEEWKRNLERFENMSRTISRASLHDRSRHASNSDEIDSDSETEDLNRIEQLSHSQVQLPTFIKKSRNIPPEMLMDIRKNGSNLQHILKQYFQSLDAENTQSKNTSSPEILPSNELMVTSNDHVVFADEEGNITGQEVKRRSKKKPSHSISKKNPSPQTIMQYYPLYRKDLFYRRSLTRFTSTPQIRSKSCPELHLEMLDDSSDDEDGDYCYVPRLLRLSRHIKKMFKMMFDLKILKTPSFLLFVMSNFLLYFWYDVPYVFLNDIAKEDGIENPAFIISTLGIVNTFGQIIYGFIGDKNIDLTILYGVSIIFSGLAIMVVPWFMSFIPLCIIGGLFGFFISANYALSTVILVEIVGIDKLTNSYGLTMMMQGIANIIGPPVGGLLYDMSGSYDHTFLAGGIFMAFSGLLLLFVPIGKCLLSLFTGKKTVSNRAPKEREILMEDPECQKNLTETSV